MFLQSEAGDFEERGRGEPDSLSIPGGYEAGRSLGGTPRAATETAAQQIAAWTRWMDDLCVLDCITGLDVIWRRCLNMNISSHCFLLIADYQIIIL